MAARTSSGVTGMAWIGRPIASPTAQATSAAGRRIGGSAAALGAVRPLARGMFHQDGFDARRVERQGQAVGLQTVFERLALRVDPQAFGEREAEPLGDPALDLAAQARDVDRLADVLRHDIAEHRDIAGRRVHLHLDVVDVVGRRGEIGEEQAAGAAGIVRVPVPGRCARFPVNVPSPQVEVAPIVDSDTRWPGLLRTKTNPSAVSRSPGFTWSSSEAAATIFSLRSRAAVSAAIPATWVLRLPWEPPSNPPTSVSGSGMTTVSGSMPSSCATIWRIPVATDPVPFSLAPVSSTTEPSSCSLAVADPGNGLTSQTAGAMARPRNGTRFSGSQGTSASIASNCSRRMDASASTCPLGKRVAVLEEMLQAVRAPVGADRRGDMVHVRFEGGVHGHAGDSAHGGRRRRVGIDETADRAQRADAVAHRREVEGEAGEEGRFAGVGAVVHQTVGVAREDVALRVYRRSQADDGGFARRRGDDILGSGVGDLDRPSARRARQGDRMRLDAGVELAAEGAAIGMADDADPGGRQPEILAEADPDVVGPLRARMRRDPAFAKDPDRALGLEVALVLALRPEGVFHDMRRPRERVLDGTRIGEARRFRGDVAVARIARPFPPPPWHSAADRGGSAARPARARLPSTPIPGSPR